MHTNEVYSELAIVTNGPHKWWHRRWVKITGISAIIVIVFAVTLGLVLNFVVFAPKKSETNTPVATLSSSLATTISTPLSLSTTISTSLSLSTTTPPPMTPITTLPQTTTTQLVTLTTTLTQTTTTTSLVTPSTSLRQTTTTTTTTTTTQQPGKLQSNVFQSP
ncbi:unnamed protein product [Adineta steineri]|uniref:CLLAC-motif containing domain-containing protein n=2 Tax=Adineta steineri TaxID=433720 RepID=A0A815MMY2_9BILA|nr:unnamed protein product [Adineta steineri]